jgi:hypothetical protein
MRSFFDFLWHQKWIYVLLIFCINPVGLPYPKRRFTGLAIILGLDYEEDRTRNCCFIA